MQPTLLIKLQQCHHFLTQPVHIIRETVKSLRACERRECMRGGAKRGQKIYLSPGHSMAFGFLQFPCGQYVCFDLDELKTDYFVKKTFVKCIWMACIKNTGGT